MSLSEERKQLRKDCDDTRVIPNKHTREAIKLVLKTIKKQDIEAVKELIEVGNGINLDDIERVFGKDLI